MCLQKLGPLAISQIFAQLQSIISQRDYYWNEKNSVIIDCVDGVERHLCTLKDVTVIPNPRDFGVQDINDVMEERHLQTLEKLIPVLNGLLLVSKDNQIKVLSSPPYLRCLFDIFRYQIPIELHENTLCIVLNMLSICNKQQKATIFQAGVLKYLFKFIADMYELEKEVLQPNIDHQLGLLTGESVDAEDHITVFVDYSVEWNPMFKNKKYHKAEDLTIEQMQEKRLGYQMFVWKAEEAGTFRVDKQNPFSHKYASNNDQLNKKSIVRHIQSLRAIGYSILKSLQMNNVRVLMATIKMHLQSLMINLRCDIIQGILGTLGYDGLSESQWKALGVSPEGYLKLAKLGSSRAIIYPNQELLHEALELFLIAINVHEMQEYCSKCGVTLFFLEAMNAIWL